MEINSCLPLKSLLDMMLDVVCVVDEQDRFVFVSAASENVFGYSAEEMIGKMVFDLVHPDDRERTFQASREIMSGNARNLFENRYVRKDGSIVNIMWSAIWSEDHKLRIGVARDITKRKHAEQLQEALYAISEATNTAQDLPALFKRIHQIIGGLMPANNFFVALYDAPNETLNFPYFVDERHPAPLSSKLDSSTRSAEVIRSGKPLLFSAGKTTSSSKFTKTDVGHGSLSWLGVPLKSEQEVIGVLVVQSYAGNSHYEEADRDLLLFVSTQVAAAITHKTMLSRLEYMAQYDPLTSLPNRELFVDRLQVALARANRDQTLLILLFIDLDEFKPVNDTLGHAAGDILLQQVAERLKQSIRASDTVARFGGDEFVVLLEGTIKRDYISHCAEKIRKIFNAPFEIEQQPIQISPSIGVAVYPTHGESVDELMKSADQAMYSAKKQGGDRIQIKGDTK